MISLALILIVFGVLFAVLYVGINKAESKNEFEHQDLVGKPRSGIAKGNSGVIQQFSEGNNLAADIPKTHVYARMYKDAEFVNKDCASLDDFIINDNINSYDLMKLAELNEIELQIREAWYPMVIELIKELNDAGWDRKVSCIKEKFASLRFYGAHEHHDIIEKYERKSESVCETCGENGQIRYNTGWDYVACRKHYLEIRGRVAIKDNGFDYNGKAYTWDDLKNIFFDYSDYDKCYAIKVSCKNNIDDKQGNNIIYVTKNTIGYVAFLNHVHNNYKKFPYDNYLQDLNEMVFCEICGYKAVYSGKCECCECKSWEEFSKDWKYGEKHEYLKGSQINWTLDEGDFYESQHENYLKDPNHKILFTEKELREYDEY